jgi:hypothetical protein
MKEQISALDIAWLLSLRRVISQSAESQEIQMGLDIFAKVAGIPGESLDARHQMKSMCCHSHGE